MKLVPVLNVEQGLISWIIFFKGTKSLRNILEGLKSNVDIFKKTIYLFNLSS